MCNVDTNSAVKGEVKVVKKRSKNPGVRVIGGRIYDSENGKTCHQCRQKTRDFAAFCKTVKKVKSCTMIFCRKCLLNRYGEKAEEVDKLDEWSCPRCREICNCSFCMKRKGQQPTGILVHAAKATGFNSVQELLQNKGFEALEIHNLMKDANASPNKSPLSNKVLTGSKRKYNDKNQSFEKNEAISIPEITIKKKKGLKKVKSTECGESQVPTADQAKSSKLENLENCHANDINQIQKIAVQSIEKDGAITIKKAATKEKKGLKKREYNDKNQSIEKNEAITIPEITMKKKKSLKKVKPTECGESQVPTADQAKPSKLENLENCHANDISQIQKIAVQSIEKDEAITIEKVATRKKKGLKKVKLTECGVSQVPTANHAKPSKLEKYFKKSNASDGSQTQKIAFQSIEQNEAMSTDKITECGESQVPAANQANPSKLENNFKKLDASDTSQTRKITVQSIEKDEAISVDKVASKKKKGLKKVELTERGASQVPTANHANPSKLENYFKKSNASDTSQTQKIAIRSIEQNEAMSVDNKMESREKKGLKINKSTECGEGQMPTANQAKPSKLENYFKNCHASDASQTQNLAVITKVSNLKIGPGHNIECKQENVPLPLAKPLSEVAEYQFPAQDVGAALQFLEFCNSFSEILDIKKGQPECILRDIIKSHARRLRGHSALAQFCIKLLDLIYDDVKKDGDGWLQSLKTCIEESECELKGLSVDCIKGSYGFESLEPSQKLLLLNFLCDEVLLTEVMRKFIDEAEAKLDEKRKEAKQKVADAKKQEKLMKQKAKDEMAKAMLSAQDGKSLSISELDEILLKLKTEAERVHAEVSTSLELKTQNDQRANAVRTDPVLLESNGKIFWKLNSYGNRSITILQEIGSWDSVTLQDKWFVFSDEEKKEVEKYVQSLRTSSLKRCSTDDIKDSNKTDGQASKTEVAGKTDVLTNLPSNLDEW